MRLDLLRLNKISINKTVIKFWSHSDDTMIAGKDKSSVFDLKTIGLVSEDYIKVFNSSIARDS